MKLHQLSSLLALVVLLAVPACAYEFQPIGFESISMGGAGVASARGFMAGYYNPALLGKSLYATEAVVSAGVGVRDNNLAASIDRLHADDLVQTIDNIATDFQQFPPAPRSAIDRQHLEDALAVLRDPNNFTPANSLSLMPSAAVGAQIKNFAVGVFVTSNGSANAVVDKQHTDIILPDGSGNYIAYDPVTDVATLSSLSAYTASSLDYAIKNGLDYIQLRGIGLAEVPISTARRIQTRAGTVYVGMSLKAMQGVAYAGTASIDTGSGDITGKLDQNNKQSTTVGADVGMLYEPRGLNRLTLGLVCKDINSPSFSMPGGGTIKVAPMTRAGADLALVRNKVDVAADIDLSRNDSYDGTATRYVGGGINLHPASWFSLRGGAMQNLDGTDQVGTIYTGGLGFGMKWFQFDIAAQLSAKGGQFDGHTVPRYARLNASIVSRW